MGPSMRTRWQARVTQNVQDEYIALPLARPGRSAPAPPCSPYTNPTFALAGELPRATGNAASRLRVVLLTIQTLRGCGTIPVGRALAIGLRGFGGANALPRWDEDSHLQPAPDGGLGRWKLGVDLCGGRGSLAASCNRSRRRGRRPRRSGGIPVCESAGRAASEIAEEDGQAAQEEKAPGSIPGNARFSTSDIA